MGYGNNEHVVIRTDYPEINAKLIKMDKSISLFNVRKGFVAHRGLNSVAPEDTLKAITEAGRRGFIMCEVDPQITSDGYWVLSHDNTVDRTTDGTGTISAMTLAQVQACKIDTPTQQIDADEVIRIPLFEDVVKEASFWGMGLNIDGGKFSWNQAKAEYLYGLLRKYNIEEKSMISLPSSADRPILKQYAPELAVCIASTVANIDADLVEVANYKYPILAYQSSTLTDAVITKCNDANIPIYVWSANDNKTAYQWLNKGVTFIETDYILSGGVA